MSKKAIAFAIVGSVALHTAALSIGRPPEEVQIAATEGMGIASLGNSFEDMVMGDPVEVPPEEILEPLEEEEPLPEEEIEPELQELHEIEPPKQALEVEELVEAVEVAASDVVVVEALPEALPEVKLEEVELVLEAPPLLEAVPEPEVVEAVEEVLEELPEPSAEAVAEAPRPPRRPERPPEPVRQERPREERPREARPAQQQNAARGQETGSAATPSNASQGNAARAQAAEAGNAAVSNYPGTVMRKLSRTRRGNVSGRGTAMISFTIGANGAAQGISVAQSSGNDRIDRAGMELVQRASPFGPPPAGAQTRFTYEFSAR